MSTRAVLTGTKGTYPVSQRLGGTDEFSLFLSREAGKPDRVIKIATDVAHNGVLDREAFTLTEMREEADQIETEYAKTVKNALPLNYQLCFPTLIESFIAEDQEGRRVNVMEMPAGPDITRLVPIGHIPDREQNRVDPKTSAWIMGKLLKLLVFAHSQGLAVGQVTGDNVLIERDEHYVAVFDWTKAVRYPEEIPDEVAAAEIAAAAQEVFALLGGDAKAGTLPPDEQLEDDRYAALLKRFASGAESDASNAHEEFYALVRALWPHRGFHPYATHPI